MGGKYKMYLKEIRWEGVYRINLAQLTEKLHYKPEGRGFDSRWGNRDFLLTFDFRLLYGPGVDSATNKNE